MTTPTARRLLAVAAVAVAFAAADTYVVVLALPDMMLTVGLGVDELQRAAPIVSGFLLGYIAMLPLIGRIADVRGRVPVLTASLLVFSFGSLVTALAFDLPSVVTGRFLQGVGGGGLVPATLALVADLYPPERRAVPLGIVSAVQEVGSVLGPLLGAVVLAVAPWEAIFVLNLAVGLALAVVVGVAGDGVAGEPGARQNSTLAKVRARHVPTTGPQRTPQLRKCGVVAVPDPLGLLLLAVFLAALVLLLWEPEALVTSVSLGTPFVPVVGESRWLTPLALVAVVALVLLVARCWWASRPLVDLRGWLRDAGRADPVGSGLLALALAGVVLAFATADPAVRVFSPAGPWLLAGSAVAAVLLVLHLRRASDPLVPHGALRRRPAWGSLVVSFFVGAALIAALVDIPVYARLTTYRDSQLLAALVLLRLLVAVPVGAVLGGRLARRLAPGAVTALGMTAAVAGFVWMGRWDAHSLEHWTATLPLVLTGLGFGLALAPVNLALLDATDAAVHGVASALVVVARMVGMLVGISVLTTVGLRRYYEAYRPDHEVAAGIVQVHTIFTGAALCAALAGVLALTLFGRRPAVG
ncbi:MFS transporter [Nocardioides mangrovicus]|uniref:MFS transporter n=1 Tax=Nocardioides mangrovicus TaxID=2478913 RepID=A0A3L8P431_9ACTN|nr:MFS transporter [Nocardioides mangrovicus]RLV50166.1 MFS transporter [Nocardioides mangrovicus]